MKITFILAIALAFSSCSLYRKPKPSVSLDEVNFIKGPIIIKEGEDLYLQYQIDPKDQRYMPALDSYIEDSSLFIYFSVLTSFPERGHLVKQNLLDLNKKMKSDDTINTFFWLNKNEAKVKLDVN